MVKEIVLIILLFNGEMLLKPYDFIVGSSIRSHWKGTVHECFTYGDTLREELSEYKEFGLTGKAIDQGWYLYDGTGTWQGFMCN
tara:strand:+ start:204 stop:455 length:252 start_codon:yes stop_codon:yes gene_type:complete